MTRYCVTGAQGFVGRYLVAQILATEEDSAVLGLGRSSRSDDVFTHCISLAGHTARAPLPDSLRVSGDSRYLYEIADIQRPNLLLKLLRDFKPDVIFHMASGLRDDPPSDLFRTNVSGTIQLIEAIAASGIKVEKIIMGSSGGIYGIPEVMPLSEDAGCNPIDMYSVSKLAAEQASRILARQHHLPVVWARLFNLAGPGQDERHICGRFASQAAAILAGLVPPVMTVQPLSTTRDFIDICDTAVALRILARYGEPGLAYNVASGIEVSMNTVLEETLNIAGLSHAVRVEVEACRPIDIPRHFANINRLKFFGFQPRRSLRQTLEDGLSYYCRALVESDKAKHQ
jgi:nucleoside-diphosphate-sugar epimerase